MNGPDDPVRLAPVWGLIAHRTLFGGRDADDHLVVVRLPKFKRGDVVSASVTWRGSQPSADEPGVQRNLELLLRQIGREHGITVVAAKPAEAADLAWCHRSTTDGPIDAPGLSCAAAAASRPGRVGHVHR